jgi:hypothetical protein
MDDGREEREKQEKRREQEHPLEGLRGSRNWSGRPRSRLIPSYRVER